MSSNNQKGKMVWPPENTVRHKRCLFRAKTEETQEISTETSFRVGPDVGRAPGE